MRARTVLIAALTSVGLAAGPNLAHTQRVEPQSGAGREIPVPRIATRLGTLPGVNELPRARRCPTSW